MLIIIYIIYVYWIYTQDNSHDVLSADSGCSSADPGNLCWHDSCTGEVSGQYIIFSDPCTNQCSFVAKNLLSRQSPC